MVGENNKMDGFLNKGEVSQAAQLAMSVLKIANAEPECGQGLSIVKKILVRTFIFIFFSPICSRAFSAGTCRLQQLFVYS